MAALSNTLLMIPRELPQYFKVAYQLRYSDEPNIGNCLARISQTVKRIFTLLDELLNWDFDSDFQPNRDKLQRDFTLINSSSSVNTKPICIYFVSSHDYNGAILGDQLYYYHHYKIKNLQKHFQVAPTLVSSQAEMKTFLRKVKQDYPAKEIKFVDIVSHGGNTSLAIHRPGEKRIQANELDEDLFSDCSRDATILLDACSTAYGEKNIAEEIARKTPGRIVLGAESPMWFSKPVIEIKNNVPRVVAAVHGFAVFNASVCKSFCFKEKVA